MTTTRLIITGRVQGVGYRMWAERTARALTLRGWVRNRRDGTVEMLVSGPDVSVAAMIEAANLGPPAARVTGATATAAEDDGSAGFTARETA